MMLPYHDESTLEILATSDYFANEIDIEKNKIIAE